jgi:cystathionine beta-synthase
VYGAIQVARRLGPGKLVVCILCDNGDRYLSKCFNDEWMKDMGYLDDEMRLGTVREVMRFRKGPVIFARPEETLVDVSRRMHEHGISQMPVAQTNGGSASGGGLRMIHESDLLQSLVSGRFKPTDPVDIAAKPMQGVVGMDDSLAKVQKVFDQNNIAVVVEGEKVVGIIGKIDVVEFLAARS